MLAADMSSEIERTALDNLLTALLTELSCQSDDADGAAKVDDLTKRSPAHEVQLLVLRFFSALISRGKVCKVKSLLYNVAVWKIF